jgi:hypothetical protein
MVEKEASWTATPPHLTARTFYKKS